MRRVIRFLMEILGRNKDEDNEERDPYRDTLIWSGPGHYGRKDDGEIHKVFGTEETYLQALANFPNEYVYYKHLHRRPKSNWQVSVQDVKQYYAL